MIEEQKQALIEWLKPQIDELQNVSDEVPFGLDSDSAMHLNTMRVALAALTAQPDDWKQRAEAAEAKLAGLNDEAAHERNLRSKFETNCKVLRLKLAELEKQEPVGHFMLARDEDDSWWYETSEQNDKAIPLYTRPAPAADLADLVSEEMTPDMMKAVQCNSELGAYAAANLAGAYDLFDEFWKVARATMLRKIEEAK